MAQVDQRKRSLEQEQAALADPALARKKLKTSDLPLTQNKRAAIEAILHTFKKKGEFDSLRKDAFQKFDQSVCPTAHHTTHSSLTSAALTGGEAHSHRVARGARRERDYS